MNNLKNDGYVPLFRARSLYHPKVQCVPKWFSRVGTSNSFCVMRATLFPFNSTKENKLRLGCAYCANVFSVQQEPTATGFTEISDVFVGEKL